MSGWDILSPLGPRQDVQDRASELVGSSHTPKHGLPKWEFIALRWPSTWSTLEKWGKGIQERVSLWNCWGPTPFILLLPHSDKGGTVSTQSYLEKLQGDYFKSLAYIPWRLWDTQLWLYPHEECWPRTLLDRQWDSQHLIGINSYICWETWGHR